MRGEPLTAAAMASLSGWCDAVLVGPGGRDPSTPLDLLCHGADRIVVHDPLCPLLAPAALSGCVAALLPGQAVLGVRPVTDTLKRVEEGELSSTIERDLMAALASPVVFAADAVEPLTRLLPTAGDLGDLAALVGALAGLCRLRGLEVPSAGRRIGDADDLAVLTVLAGMERGTI